MTCREKLEAVLKEEGYGKFWHEVKSMSKQRLDNYRRDKRQRLSPGRMRLLYAKQDGRCVICQEPVALMDMEADHINPNRSDFNAPGNWQLLCRPCNREKGAMSVMNQTKKYNKTAVEIIGDSE